MSYTNISIPNKYGDRKNELLLKIELLKTELDFVKKINNQLVNDLSNIPEAIEDHGYVTLYNREDGVDIKLVKDESR